MLIDPLFLRSLPRRSLASGIAEAIKMGIIRDTALFELIEGSSRELTTAGFTGAAGISVLRSSIWAMLEELRKNPYEDQTYERVVDFGHTFSPLLESAMGFDIEHGEAVAIDMALSATIALLLGLIPQSGCERILQVLENASLPIFAPKLTVPLCREGIVEAARHRGGSMNLVVPGGIGWPLFLKNCADVSDSVLEYALASLSSRAAGIA